MSQKTNKHTDVDKESLRLEYCFEKGINFLDRIIQVTGSIEDGSSFDYLDAALTEMERNSKKAITIKINSPGGSVYEALAMIDRIKDSKCQIITKCYGHAMSAAGLILASGDKRYIGSRSWFMYHEMYTGVAGTVADLRDQVEQVEREMKDWALCMEEFSKKPTEFWQTAAHKHDFHLNSQQCLEYGIVDGIL